MSATRLPHLAIAALRALRRGRFVAVLVLTSALVVAGCSDGPTVTPAITPGTAQAPRDVNIIAKDDQFIPSVVDVVPGESVVIHVINGGLDVHELVIGDQAVQDAWEAAEAAVAGAPPGPTPLISVPPGLAGLRVVLLSGQRVDIAWNVPSTPASGASGGLSASGSLADAGNSGLIAGCHIPGHYAKGMHVPIEFVHH